MFSRIFIESHLADDPGCRNIVNSFKDVPIKHIKKIEDVWGRVKRPYLQKRTDLNLFIGTKKGALVKRAPEAYGIDGDPHYFFIHSYNCIYECEYCYLQGYFNTPDIVLFVNHEDIGREIERITEETRKKNPRHTPWFHAGEYSDSLALSHLTGEIPFYFDLFKRLPQAKLEFRTKSASVREILKCHPLPNVITTFSLAPDKVCKTVERGTAPLKARLKAIEKLHQANHPVGIHLDPIMYETELAEEYGELVEQIDRAIPCSQVSYFSLGVPRFTGAVHRQVRTNYPESPMWRKGFISSFDDKMRYKRPIRHGIIATVREILLKNGVAKKRVYSCMESHQKAQS